MVRAKDVAIGAGILGGAYLLSQRGSEPALPGSNLSMPAASIPTPQLPELNINVEAPAITLPTINLPTINLPAITTIISSPAAAAETVRNFARRVNVPAPPSTPGLPVPDGPFLPDLPGGAGQLLGDAGELLDAARDRALALWNDPAATRARDAAEEAWERARSQELVQGILDRVRGTNVGTVRLSDLRARTVGAVLDRAAETVRDLAPGLGDLGLVGEAAEGLGRAKRWFDNLTGRRLGPQALAALTGGGR